MGMRIETKTVRKNKKSKGIEEVRRKSMMMDK
jgi:hypothetical protein